ncbi:hypothetical protein B0H19DRAFT_1080918 [Mycena capillaripes]|nr:hypothetical protein B0H19DRAFT_1080918 [Mycena capillaripes]
MVISTLTVSSTVLLFASCALAQVSMLPDCSLGCATQAATKASCSLSDNACLCNSQGFVSSVVGCARTTSCSPEEQTRISDILPGGQQCTNAANSGSIYLEEPPEPLQSGFGASRGLERRQSLLTPSKAAPELLLVGKSPPEGSEDSEGS